MARLPLQRSRNHVSDTLTGIDKGEVGEDFVVPASELLQNIRGSVDMLRGFRIERDTREKRKAGDFDNAAVKNSDDADDPKEKADGQTRNSDLEDDGEKTTVDKPGPAGRQASFWEQAVRPDLGTGLEDKDTKDSDVVRDGPSDKLGPATSDKGGSSAPFQHSGQGDGKYSSPTSGADNEPMIHDRSERTPGGESRP